MSQTATTTTTTSFQLSSGRIIIRLSEPESITSGSGYSTAAQSFPSSSSSATTLWPMAATTPVPPQNRCLTGDQMQMHGSDFEWYLQRYVFPCLVVFGILGNALNLTVLLNRKMHSRANTFLAMLAFADIFFLSLLIPNIMANYSIFSLNWYFRLFYLSAKVHLISLANWASAVAIWCVIAVCADRLIGIRNPLFARGHVPRAKMAALICAIVAVPGLLTAHQHVAHVCLVRAFCNGTQLYSKCLPVNQDRWFAPNQTNPYSELFRKFISISTLLNVVFSIIFPIILLAALNLMLLCALRRRSIALNGMNRFDSSEKKPMKPSQSTSTDGLSQHLLHAKTEQRVTLTVTLIVTMFTLTNGPSAVVHLLQNLLTGVDQKEWYNVVLVCSALVIFGKASNFILFCLCSKHFRRRLFTLAQKKVHERLGSMGPSGRRRSSCSAMALTNGGGGGTRRGTAVGVGGAKSSLASERFSGGLLTAAATPEHPAPFQNGRCH